MKPSYLTVNFRQTVAQRFPVRADELNAAFEARLQALRAEKPPAAPTVLAACVIGAAIGFGAAWLTLPQPAQARQPEAVQTGPQLPAEADASAEPPAPDSAAGEHRYEVVQQQLSWDDARIWCQSRGGHLAAEFFRQPCAV